MRAVVVIVLLASALPGLAVAQPDEAQLAQRRAWIDEAIAASDAGDHERALSLGERAGAVQWSPSLRRFVAEELRHLGRVEEALEAARGCARDAATSTLPRSEEHREACEGM